MSYGTEETIKRDGREAAGTAMGRAGR